MNDNHHHSHSPSLAKLKLAAFDLDGTLKAVQSPYGYIHQSLGVDDQADILFKKYQQGELTYEEWGREEISLWQDISIEQLEQILQTIPYRPGAIDFISRLRAGGVRIALVSAGFDLHVKRCARDLQVDFAYYNLLGIRDGRLTGEFIARVNANNKGSLVKELQARFGAKRSETLVAGDTPHDTSMYSTAAFCIAVAPSDPTVKNGADLLLADGDWTKAWELIEKAKPGWLPI